MIYLGDKTLPWHSGITVKEALTMVDVTRSSIVVSVDDIVVPQDKMGNHTSS